MSKVKMPEPVAYRWRVPISNSSGAISGESDWKYGATHNALPWWTHDGLITTDQAEAYANARVREAMEEAAAILQANAESCKTDTRIILRANAEAVLAMIPKETT